MKIRAVKRIIASLICVGMLISMVPMMNISAAYDYSDVVEKTTALNIIPERINAEDFVTRKELAKFIYYMLNVKENGAVYSTEQFDDVDMTSEYYEYISVMTGYKLMVGVGDKTFAPDMKTTFGMVSRVLLNATGYYPLAHDGTMESFTSVAASIGLLDNVEYDTNSEIVMGELAQMIWNAMKLRAVETTISGESKHIVTDNTLLWHYHKIAESKGMVTANEDTSINKELGTEEGCVVIDKTVYVAGTDYVKDMLGRNIRYYYKHHDDFDKPIVMWAEATSSKNLTFDATEITDVTYDTSGNITFKTEVGNNKKEYTLSSVVNVVFNGKYRACDLRDLKPLIGNVELVDADNNRVYELAIVTSYVPYVVGSIDTSTKSIYDKSGRAPITVDDKARIKIKRNGAIIALEELAQNDIMLVAADKTTYDAYGVMVVNSAKSMIYDIIVSKNIIGGKPSAVSFDEKTAVIDGTTYDIRATFDYAGNTKIKLGENATYYVDAFSNIVYVEFGTKVTDDGVVADTSTVGGGTYGFVTRVRYNSYDEIVTMRIFNFNGDWATYEVAEKVRIDRVTYKGDANGVFSSLTATGRDGEMLIDAEATPNTNTTAYAIVYKLNDDGKISYIDTPLRNSGENESNSLWLNDDSWDTGTDFIFMGTWKYKFCIPDGFNSIEVPYITDASGAKRIKVEEAYERNYKVKRYAGTLQNPEFQLFNAGEELTPKFALERKLLNTTGSNLNRTYPNYVITKLIETVNDDNEEIVQITATGTAGTKILEINGDTMVRQENDPSHGSRGIYPIEVSDLSRGDVIAFVANGTIATTIIKRIDLVDASGNLNENYHYRYNNSNQYDGGPTESVWGKIYKVNNGNAQLYFGTTTPTMSDVRVYNVANRDVFCYDMADNTCTQISLDKLTGYAYNGNSDDNADRIFMCLRHTEGIDIFVFRNVPLD
ncbi:MAG: S-layer homology domain-containing protein [Clostridia bacterium]|nr:S-layer homology domain-containing protein [Clostridia bacterium]MBQ8637486.1 S-layer homology domain-containing protein [Clostridia bacterium]